MTRPSSPQLESSRLHFALTLGVTLLAYGMLYRIRLFFNLYYATPSYRAFQPTQHSALSLIQSLWTELAWAAQAAAFGWLAWTLCSFLFSGRDSLSRYTRPFRWVALGALLLSVAFLYSSHLRVMFAVQSGLTYDLWSEGVDAFSPRDILTFLSLTDAVFLLLPHLLFWALWKLPSSWRPFRTRVAIVATLSLLLIAVIPQAPSSKPLDHAVVMTPVQFLVSDYLKTRKAFRKPDGLGKSKAATPEVPRSANRKTPPSSKPTLPTRMLWAGRAPQKTIRLIHPAFVQTRSVKKTVPSATTTKHWNVLFYMLESVGTRYIFDKSRSRRMPMKFLHSLAQKGWYFTNHYASANSSPRAIFSILTGLYPSPQLKMFEMRRSVCSPSLYSFLNKRYTDGFFMTPGSLGWYFPRYFFQNNGPPHLLGARKFRRFKRYGSFPNEIDVHTALIRRIQRLKEPFLASYLSFLPHGPYDDYGPKYRIIRNTHRDINRYYNNLYVLDLQIERLFKALKKAGVLERTIVVFVGDHGQAFGQHRRNWGHSRKSYNENYHAPLLFYQPKLFKPKVDTRRTSHVDILPTLLDALKIPYNPLLFQGESLFQDKFYRKQIFLYGNESTLSLIDQNNIKMQYLSKRRRCWVYDLNSDPDEKVRLSCRPFVEQRAALRLYLKQQPKLRKQYNQTCRKNTPFFGLKHPGL